MARYIDADKIRYYFNDMVRGIGREFSINYIVHIIDKQPTADVEKVKHGEWKQGVPYVCSICGKPAPDEKNTSERYYCWLSPYCPHCGAKMDGGKVE